mmetsp:Transcript_5644/g.14410  ORF Transcript_5644/g.14410 Transcript_5644/m.14410 type:complete len:377 (-) Transcript_5644:185-1315(-)
MSFLSLQAGGWDALFDADGKMLFEYQFKKDAFENGVPPEIRADVWKYLLGLYPCTSTLLHRIEYIEDAAARYDGLLDAAATADAGADRTFQQHKKIIDKDVARTDRDHPFFAGDDNPNLVALQNVLVAHTVLDPELGYVQGMNDIACTVLYVMKRELPTFWCFAAVMRQMRGNFINIELHDELQLLKDTVGYLDPELQAHMNGCAGPDTDWLFCHRWLLLNFRREFDLEAILPLWERMWAQHSTAHFNTVVAVGILSMHRDQILAIKAPDELLGFLQHLAVGLDVNAVIVRAQEALALLAATPGGALPPQIRRIVTPASGDTFAPPPKLGFVRMRGRKRHGRVGTAAAEAVLSPVRGLGGGGPPPRVATAPPHSPR